MKRFYAVALFFVGLVFVGCTSLSSMSFSLSQKNLVDNKELDRNTGYVFGRFSKGSDNYIGVYIKNLETKKDVYIEFNKMTYDNFKIGGTQDDFNKGMENVQKESISVIALIPGKYKISAIQLASEKRNLKEEKFNPEFVVNANDAVYIGDWSGMENGGNQIMINSISNKYEYTKKGLLLRNSVFQDCNFVSSL